MIIINNENKLNEFNKLNENSLYIVTDFDGTLTKGTNDSSWSSIFKNPLVSKEFIEECINIFNKYHKYELDNKIPLEDKLVIMDEWYNKNIKTLINFNITEDIINYAAKENRMKFRKNAKEFIEKMYKKRIPIIIISAGVGNIIEQFLIRNNCYYNNIFITSNFLKYKNGMICGVKNDNLIHPLNKNVITLAEEIKEKIRNRQNVILLGDSISDLNMITDDNKKILKIGFLEDKLEERIEEFKKEYDIVCTEDTSYKEVIKKLTFLDK